MLKQRGIIPPFHHHHQGQCGDEAHSGISLADATSTLASSLPTKYEASILLSFVIGRNDIEAKLLQHGNIEHKPETINAKLHARSRRVTF